MCQACWALASRRSGGALAADDAAVASPRPRFSAAAEWVEEPGEDDRSPVADATLSADVEDR